MSNATGISEEGVFPDTVGRSHKCLNFWDGRVSFGEVTVPGVYTPLNNWPFPLNVPDMLDCCFPGIADFNIPPGPCGEYNVINEAFQPTITTCLAQTDPVTGLLDFDDLIRCFAEDATLWTESGTLMRDCVLDDDICGEYFDDSLASCFLNAEFPDSTTNKLNLTFPEDTGFAVGEEHVKCLLEKMSVSDAAVYITEKMVEPVADGGCADFADYEAAWTCGRQCYLNDVFYINGTLTPNEVETCIVDCTFEHIQVGEGVRYFTQCLVDDNLCRNEFNDHLDDSWDCMKACSQQTLANDPNALRPENECWVPCAQKLLNIEDLDVNAIVQDVLNRPTCLDNSAIAAIVILMAVGFCTLTILTIGYCARQKAEQVDGQDDSAYRYMDDKKGSPMSNGPFQPHWLLPTDCLANHENVSTASTFGIPAMILLAIALFYWAHNAIGATVNVEVSLGPEEVPLIFENDIELLSFALGNSMCEMWKAEVYPLALLIALLTGVWPYLKLTLMAFCWFAPRRMLPVPWREKLMQWLDALNKWAFLDLYVLILFVAAFQLEIVDIGRLIAPGWIEEDWGLIDIKVIVIVKDAFYANMFAAVVSQVASHFLMGVHRANEKAPLPDMAVAGEETKIGTFLMILALGLLVGSMAIAGSVVDSFAFTFGGATELVLYPDQLERDFSMFSLLDSLSKASEEATGRDASSIQFTVYLTMFISLIIPLINLCGLMVLSAILFVPSTLSVKRMNSWFVAIEGLSSWSALDVFTVSIGAAVLQIEQFADVIVASIDLPGVLDPFLENCGGLFSVKASVNGIFAMLVLSSVFLFVMNSMIQSRISAKIDTYRVNDGKQSVGAPLLASCPTPQNDF